MFSKRVCLFFVALLIMWADVCAQVQTGAPSFASLDGNGPEAINLGNLNAYWNIPIVSKTGRSLPFSYNLAYNSLVWYPVTSSGNQSWQPVTTNGTYWGWQGLSKSGSSEIVYDLTYTTGTCYYNRVTSYQEWQYTADTYIDPSGTRHKLVGPTITYFQSPGGNCPASGPQPSSTVSFSTQDGSGYVGSMTAGQYGYFSMSLQDKYGATINAPFVTSTSQGSTNLSEQDSNGNQITVNNGQYTDTTGTVALTVTGTAPTNTVLSYPLPSGSTSASANYTVSYKNYTVATAFSCGSIAEYGPTSIALVDKVTRPDGTAYQFSYEPTPGNNNDVTGRVASVTLPTGGTVSYSYTGGCNGSAGINPDGSVGSLTRTTTDGTRTYVRPAINGNATSTTRTDEKNNQTYYAFTLVSNDFYETHRKVYQGNTSGSLLEERFTCYNGFIAPCDGYSMSEPVTEADVTDSFNGGSQSLTKNTYTDGGTLLTKSASYQGSTLWNTATYAYNITQANVAELTAVNQSDGSGNNYSSSSYGYDEQVATRTSGLPNHSTPSGSPGNQTSAHISAGSTTLTTTTAYYDTGVPVSTTAPGGFTTSYGYDSTGTFATTTTLPTTANGTALATSATYDVASGVALSATGPNSGQTTTINSYDNLLRPTQVTQPTGGQWGSSYSGANYQNVTKALGSGSVASHEVVLDSYGRVSRQTQYNGISDANHNWYQTDTCYDATGFVRFVPTTYAGSGLGGASANKICSGSGTAYSYDALGRVTSVQTDDGATTMQYNNRAVRSADVNGVQRITQYDILGRISGVCEISNNTLNGVSPTPCGMDINGTGFVTSYSYDLANHTTTITQGSQSRVVQTDSAGRTVSVQEPERGTTSYSYAYNSLGMQVVRTRPRANQQGAAVTHTTTQYDAIGRMISIDYDDGTPAKRYWYDVQGPLGWTQTPSNQLGNLVNMATQTNSGAYLTRAQMSYDSIGEETTVWQCAPSICGTGNQEVRGVQRSSYDYLGNLINSFDGASGSISYGRSPAGELTSMTQNTYTDIYNSPNLVSGVKNGPFGPTSYSLGNGLGVAKTYDSLGRNNGVWVCNGTASPGCNNATQLYGNITNHFGFQVTGMCDTSLNQCQNNAYDEFNRLTGVSGNNSSYSYSYDRFGNRLTQTPIGSTSGPAPSYNFNNSNQITSLVYDAAGNLLNDGISHNFTYDAEGNVVSVDGGSTANYVYDALNRRVSSQTSVGTTEYVYNAQGQRTGSWLVNGNTSGFGNEGRIYWDGQQFAYRSWNGSTYFQHKNPLGTDRLRTNYQGVAINERSLAFGDAFSSDSSDLYGAAQDNDQYAGLEHDGESWSEHAVFRQYSSTQGRWMSPDPYDGSYDAANPQSLNRYSYVLNGPLNFIDGFGLIPNTADSIQVSAEDGGGWLASLAYYNGGGGGGSDGRGRGGGGGNSGNSNTPNNQPSKLQSCLSKTWAGTDKAGLALDAAGAILTLAAPEASPLIGLASSAIGATSAFRSINQGLSVGNTAAAGVSLGGAVVSSTAPSAHFFASTSSFTASLKNVGRGFAAAAIIIDAANFADGVSTCINH